MPPAHQNCRWLGWIGLALVRARTPGDFFALKHAPPLSVEPAKGDGQSAHPAVTHIARLSCKNGATSELPSFAGREVEVSKSLAFDAFDCDVECPRRSESKKFCDIGKAHQTSRCLLSHERRWS